MPAEFRSALTSNEHVAPRDAGPAGRWRPFLAVGAIWLATRLVVVIAGAYGARSARTALSARAQCGPQQLFCPDPGLPGFNLWGIPRALYVMATQWDASWYRAVLQQGYHAPGYLSLAKGFYPGYPLLAGIVYWPATLLHHGSGSLLGPVALMIVSNISLAIALWALWQLYEPLLGRSATLAGCAFFLAAPGSMFLSAAMSESSFIAASALSLLAAHRGRWVAAGLAGAVACLVRPHGVLLAVPLAMLWLRASERPVLPSVVGLVCFIGGFGAYPVYTWANFGDPLLYSHLKQQDWGAGLVNPLPTVVLIGRAAVSGIEWLFGGNPGPVPQFAGARNFGALMVTNTVALYSALAGVLVGWLRLPLSHVVFAALMLIFPLVSVHDILATRYVAATWPIFFVFGSLLRRPWLAVPAAAVSCVGLAVISYDFQLHYAVG